MAGVNLALPGQHIEVTRASANNPPGNTTAAIWTGPTGYPSGGAAPSSGVGGDVPTKATAGALPFVNPASGNTYLGRGVVRQAAFVPQNYVSCVLYDRLWHNSGISSTLTSGQTITSVALTRPNANGDSAEAWWQVYVLMGAGTPTVTLAYTNQVGTTRTTGTSGALSTAMTIDRTGPFQLDLGDTGVRSIQTWTASATFTSGTIGLVIRRQVACLIASDDNSTVRYDAVSLAMPRIYDSACLELLHYFVGNTATPFLTFSLIQG